MLNLREYQCIILDLDGTLIDSTLVWAKVDMDFLGKRGIPVSEEYMKEIKIHTFETGAVYTKDKYNLPESTDEIIKEWYDLAKKAYATEVKIKPYVMEFLKLLKDKGMKIVAATSSDRILYEPCLKMNGIYDYFDAFTQTNEVARGKKFPDVYIAAAKKADTPIDKCIVFEDVLDAVKGAKSGDFKVVGVYDRASDKDWEEIKGVTDMSIESYNDLIEMWR